jgi:hypothetical protein
MFLSVDKHTSKILKSQIELCGFCIHDSLPFVDALEQLCSLYLMQTDSTGALRATVDNFLPIFKTIQARGRICKWISQTNCNENGYRDTKDVSL